MTGKAFIAIDGGGSGSRAVLRVPGQPDRHTQSGPANAFTDRDGAAQTITDLAKDLSEAPLPITGGIAGCRLPEITAELVERVQSRLPNPLNLCDDSVTTTRGALGGHNGVVISLGTGSFAARAQGHTITSIGGCGLNLGDDASGAWIGRKAVASALKAMDGLQPHDALTKALSDPHPLLQFTHAPPAEFAAIAPEVLRHAQTPTGGRLIARAIRAVEDMLKALGTGPNEPLILTGGFGTALMPHLPETLQTRLQGAEGSSLDGAIAMAEAGS